MKLNELCLICILHFAFCTSIIFCPIPSFRMPWLLERRKLIYTSNVKLLYFRIDCKCPIPIKISFSFFSSIALPFNPPGKRANAVENSKDFTFQKRTVALLYLGTLPIIVGWKWKIDRSNKNFDFFV